MKFILILCLIQLQASASLLQAQATKVTLKKNAISAKEFFMELERLTDVSFVYSPKDIESIPVKDIDFDNEELKDVLDKFLKDTDLIYDLHGHTVVLRTIKATQQRQELMEINGLVRDSDGHPLPGVTILMKGTEIGLATDVNGNFKMVIPKQDDVVLIFSFVGMVSKEQRYNDERLMEVTLYYEDQEIDEVVITGFQVINKRKNTSAITSLKMDDIMRPGITSLDQMLEGQVPDLMFMNNSGQVGVVPKLRIRGTSTLVGNREPLWVIDGVVMQDPIPVSPEELNDPDYVNRIGNAIAGINPQDIERIDVLKDAAATTLYGAKAANGVIVITTKRGHIGDPIINYNVTTSLKQRPRYSDRKINLMNSKERMQFSRELINSGFTFGNNINIVGYEGALIKLYQGSISYSEFVEEVKHLETVNTDWFKILTKDSFSHQHTLSISGGSQKIRYYTSVGYSRDNDVIKGNNNERYSAILNLNSVFTDYFSVEFGMNGNVSSRKYNQTNVNPIDYAYNTSRAIPAYDENGNYHYYLSPYYIYYYEYNILNELDNSSLEQRGSSITFNVNANFKFTEYLNVNAIVSYTASNTDIEGYYGEETFYASTLRLSSRGEQAEKGENSQSEMPFGGELTINNTRNNNWMARVQINFDKSFGYENNHNINAALGYEASSSRYRGNSSISRGYYKDRGKQFTSISLTEYPKYRDWLETNSNPSLTDNLTNLISGYGTITYGYKDIFTLNANTRIDGSNRFGDRSNEKLLPIWSVSGNYNISDHLGFSNKWIDYLTFKTSYGYQGNMLEGQSPTMIIKQLPLDDLYNELVSEMSIYPNPNLRWEKTSSFNFGILFSLFHRRIQVESDIYFKRTKDAFLNKNISSVNGLSSYMVNAGTIKNSGYNVSLTAVPVQIDDFRWILATSFSRTINKMTTLPSAEQHDLTSFLTGNALVKGKAVGTFYSYRFLGLSPIDGGPLLYDMKDRQEELEDRSQYDVYTTILKASGNRTPTISGNLSNTLRYRNWRMNINLVYSLGAKTRLFRLFDNTSFSPEYNVNKDLIYRWKSPGDENRTKIPAILKDANYTTHFSTGNDKIPKIASSSYEMYDFSDIRVVSANYLKCSNIGLTYDFKENILRSLHLKRFEISLSAANLFTITSKKLKGQTPTQGGFSEVELSDRPIYTLGINLSF